MKRNLLPLSVVVTAMIASNIWAATYTYDDLNRLVRVEYESGTSIEYQYDLVGNIVKVINTSTNSEQDLDKKNDENKEDDKNKEEEEKKENNESSDDRANHSNKGTYQKVIVKEDKESKVDEEEKDNIYIVLNLKNTELLVNNTKIKMDTQMFISSKNRLMVPIRYVSYALGIDEENITWNSMDKTVVIKGEKEIKIGLNQKYMLVQDVKVKLNEEMMLVDGRTFLPIADICRAFGLKYSWDNQLKQLTIY